MESAMKKLDGRISRLMQWLSEGALRGSLAVVFVWFGVLKPLGISPAEALVRQTVASMPLFSADAWVDVIGWWEVAIGVFFLFRRTTRLAIALLGLQMVGTFFPLLLLPEVTFQEVGSPLALTMEGQYIVKNLLIISAAIAIGGTLGISPPATQRSGRASEDREMWDVEGQAALKPYFQLKARRPAGVEVRQEVPAPGDSPRGRLPGDRA